MAGIVFVCTGNVCRSPLAEALWNERAPRLGGRTLVAASAGTGTVPGMTPPAELLHSASALAGSLADRPSRPLDAAIVQGASLVLGLDRGHRGKAIRLHPRANRYSFTLLQFARLTESLGDDDWAGLAEAEADQALTAFVTLVASRRGVVPPLADPAGDDIADPYGRSQREFARAHAQIAGAIDSIVDDLGCAGR